MLTGAGGGCLSPSIVVQNSPNYSINCNSMPPSTVFLLFGLYFWMDRQGWLQLAQFKFKVSLGLSSILSCPLFPVFRRIAPLQLNQLQTVDVQVVLVVSFYFCCQNHEVFSYDLNVPSGNKPVNLNFS